MTAVQGVIEHLQDLNSEIDNLKKRLKNDGYICIWTGDINSLPSKVLGSKWWYIMGQHIQFFSRKSLDRLMKRHNFIKVYSGTFPYVLNLHYLGKVLKRYPALATILELIFNNEMMKKINIKVYIPGEIFAVYRLQKHD